MSTTTRSKRVRKTDEEREQELTAIKADLDAAVERLANDPDQWVTFLDTVANFGARYSANNQLLILMQAEQRGFTPTMVRPYGTRDRRTGKPRAGWVGGWLVLGRHPRKGEKSLKVFAPVKRRMTDDDAAVHEARTGRKVRRDAQGRLPQRVVSFTLASVFDLAQTDGDPVEVDTVKVTRRFLAPGGQAPELLTGEDLTGALDDIVRLIKAEGYTFEWVPAASLGGANGRTVGGVKVVRVRDDVDGAHAVKTAVHELAHVLLHMDASPELHRGRAETEAESVAYVVLRALGLDSQQYSAPYVAGWADGDMTQVRAAASTVVTTARRILSALEVSDDEGGESES